MNESDIYDKTLEELVAQAQQQYFDAVLRQRAFTTAMNLAAQGVDAGWRTLRSGREWTGTVEFRWNPAA